MNIKNKIITKQLLYAVMLLFMMIWTCGAWAQNATSQEKLLYSTDFTDWDDIDRKVTVNKEVKLKTQFSDEDLTFTLNGVGADPKGTHSKFPSYTGYMITAKYTGEYSKAEPSAVTSSLKSITKIVLTQAATGGKRGIKVSVKGDGDANWVALHNETIANSKGETLTIDVNRTNCQIKFENFALDQNAYIVDLKIFGNSDGEEKKVRTLEFPLQDGIVGKYPSKIKCDKDGYAVMPEGNGFFRPGYTFVAWTDGTNDYTPGKKYQFTKDVTRIKPKMKENTYHLYDANKETTIVWPFDHSEAPTLNVFQENAQKDLSYTRHADIYIDDNTKETQDVALNINVKNGKIDNTDDRINALPGKGAVVRNGTAFTLPAIYGMKVSIKASDKVDSDNENLKTIFGTANDNVQIKLKDTANKDSLTLKDAELSADGKTVTFTYRGDEPTITLTTFVNKGSKYDYWHFESITATYPLLPNVVCNNTITNADPKKFPNEKAINAGDYKVELKDPTATSHANIGTRFKVDDVVMITPNPKYGYDFKEIIVNGTTYTTIPYEYKVKKGINNIEVKYTRKEMHKITIKPSDPKLGTVTLEPKHDNFYNETCKVGADGKPGNITQVESWFTPGTTVIASGEAIIDYMLDYWKEGDTTVKEGYTYEFTTNDKDHTYTAHFREGNVGNIIFDFGGERVNGAAEKDNYKGAESKLFTYPILNNRSFTIATNYTFFKSVDKDGKLNPNFYTLDHWTLPSDTTQHYEFGKHYSFGTEGETITLVPVFRENPTNTENRSNAPIIRYDFGRKVHKYRGPTSGVLRNVCAPTINIGSNQKFFWTTQAYFETYESGKKYNYRRDIAMWCDTGANGYIRNTDFDDWAEFGPNTTFWLIAGVGTEIRLLTYSPITTTTIDGVVPTLDKARTDSVRKVSGKKYMYVYTHTTQSTADRIPLVIGDDHTYYQWLEIHMQAANWVNLYTNVDHQNRGSIKEINVSETSEFKDFHRTEDGKGYSFRKGERVKLTFNRKKGYMFDKIVDLNNPDSDGKEFTITKKDNTSYSSTDSLRTEYTVEFDITDHRNLQIQFKETPTFHITYNPGQLASGTAPEAAWVEKGDRFTIPTNKTLYYEGNTLDHWVDENNNTFAIGKEYTAVGKDRRLFPVFKPNEFNLLDIIESGKTATATWKFAKNDGAPDINYEKTAGILVTQLKYGDKSIDMKLYLDGSQGGKFNNMSSTNTKRIQINANSILWFPATPGCTATLTASSTSDKEEKRVKIEGETLPLKDKVITKDNCKADSAYLKMDFLEGHYFKEFSVTYKHQTATLATIESLTWSYDGTKQTGTIDAESIKQQMKDNGCITFTIRPWENGETMPKLTGTASEGGSVEVTTATLTNPECEVKVKTKSGVDVETYPVKFKFEDPDDTPVIESVTINNTTYHVKPGDMIPTFTVKDLPFNGVIKVNFNRTMKQPDKRYTDLKINNTGKELVLKYWDLPNHQEEILGFTPEDDDCFIDIYGKECQQTLILNLTAIDAAVYYHHHNFNFVVGKDGDIDEAIKAANGEAEGKPYNNDKNDGHRYYIFVPDGEYQLTGNGTISWEGDDAPKDEEGKKRDDMNGKNNGQTHIKKSNISIIGQSKDNTIIRNHPTVEGISYTATLCVENNNTDFYAEDLTLENEFDYWGSMAGQSSGTGAGRADVFFDRGNRSILKNVALKSWQDTYYSNNASSDFRGYFENCDFYGAVDFICGNGNIWFEKCNLILRDRKSNNIVAPSTEVDQEWGYVFNECSIKPESDNMTKFTDKDWTLARAWGNSPACTYLNTKMYTQPQSYGWGRSMESNLKLRFHEYNSTDATGNELSLVRRSIAAGSPAAGSDDVIFSEEQANKYTLRDVVGGNDGFEPNELCMQIDAASGAKADHDENNEVWNDNISLEDNMMVWNTNQKALCYVVFKLDKETGKWKYIDNTIDTCFYLTTEHGTGDYYVRAANQRGGLGAATKAIRYEFQESYKLEIKKVGEYKEEGKDYGWSTICLPFNARVPKEVKVYATTAHNKETADYKVEDFVMTLTPVEIIDSLKGYVVYGPVGTYSFAPTSHKGGTPTILTGNPTAAAISSTNINCYVLAYKTWGLGFYKYTGATLAANRAWLPEEMVSKSNQEDLALGKRGISFVISDPTTGISHPVYTIQSHDDAIYNLNGQRVKSPNQPGIYLSRGKGKVIRK